MSKKIIVPKEWDRLAEFAAATKDFLIIIADPKSDLMWVSHNNKRVFAKVQPGMIKAVLSHSGFSSHIVSMCAAIQDVMSITFRFVKSGIVPKSADLIRNFVAVIDGALFNLTRQSKTRANIMATPKIDPVSKTQERGPMIAD